MSSPTTVSIPATPRVSVVIVSRGRPESLVWCLSGVAGLRYGAFEVIVVTDPQGEAAVTRAGYGKRIKMVAFDAANISAARNAGIAQACGEIIAFIDDDAVPEPTWLTYLTEPFDDPSVAAVGGFVRGRNGISFQWKARSVDCVGRTAPLAVDETQASTPTPPKGHAIKTEGTNMAVRRDELAALGGFDPAFQFYLDETDLNMRLAKAGYVTAIAPLAQVHHAYAASPRRRANRAVTDLHQIGASTAVYLRKHCPDAEADRAARWIEVVNEQRARLNAQTRKGILKAGESGQLLAGLHHGFEEGMARGLSAVSRLEPVEVDGFQRFDGVTGPSRVLAGRVWAKNRLRKDAAKRVARGETVSVFVFSPTTLFHRVRYTRDGYWEQVGGIFGKSERDQPWIRVVSFSQRIKVEVARVANLRVFSAED